MNKQLKITDIYTSNINNNIYKQYDIKYKDDDKYNRYRVSFKLNGETIRLDKSYLKLQKEDALKLLEDKVNNFIDIKDNKINLLENDMNDLKNHFKNTIYNEEQIEFIKSPLENSSLLGIPGGGKTQSIIGKIIYHFLEKDIIKANNYKVYTFSRRASSDFIKKGSKYSNKLFSKTSIKTIHSLASSIIKFILNTNPILLKCLILYASDLFEENNEIHHEKLKEYSALKNCKIIFIDEAQDVSEIEYIFIKKISSFYNIPIIMVGDPNQNIYQFKKGSDKFLLNHSLKKYVLVKNYRSIPSIVNIINKIRPHNDLMKPIISMRENDKFIPMCIIDNIDNIIKDILEKIQDLDIPYHKIAIIGPVKKSKPVYNSYINIGLSIFINNLKNKGIKYIKHYVDGDGDGYDDNEDINIQDGYINLLTIHGSKGLEFDTVFLLNFHHNTYGREPTFENFNNFKYLWYVGLSRAQNKLYIYSLEDKNIWTGYDLIINDVILQNKPPMQKKNIKFKESEKPLLYGVTDFLKKYLIDDKYMEYKKIIGIIEISKTYIWENDEKLEVLDIDRDMSKIYGIFMEYIFNYYYSKNYNEIPIFVNDIEISINNLIEIPEKYKFGYIHLKSILKDLITNNITINKLLQYKSSFNKSSNELMKYLLDETNNDINKEIYILLKNDVISYPKDKIINYINIIKTYFKEHDETYFKEHDNQNIIEKDLYEKIFFLTLFKYQCENESCYMLDMNFNNNIQTLIPYILKVSAFAKDLYEKNKMEGCIYKFQKNIQHNNLPIIGIIDLINENSIVDLKFSKSSSLENHVDQLIMYYLIYDASFENKKSLEVWNLYNGEKIIININLSTINKKKLLCHLAHCINEKLTNMIFFYDLETNGLIEYGMLYPDIIEIYIEEYNSKSVWIDSLVFLPQNNYLKQDVSIITGITHNELSLKGQDFKYIKNEMESLLKICKDPIFIAHNGNGFDHKIMKYNEIFDDKTLTLDSMIILNLHFKSKNIIISNEGSKKLENIYKYFFKDNLVAHRAKADVKMLIKIFEKNKISCNLIQDMI